MSTLREIKKIILADIQKDNWLDILNSLSGNEIKSIGPLFSLLPKELEIRHRIAYILGKIVSKIADTNMEMARNIIRRYMWHMNEESGNIGWGIPEAFSETLSSNSNLAKEFHRILISYVIDFKKDDNYCDNDILRRSCFWAIGNMLITHQQYAESARQWLRLGLEDNDHQCQGFAAWALWKIPPDIMDAPFINDLIKKNIQEECIIFEKMELKHYKVNEIANNLLQKINL